MKMKNKLLNNDNNSNTKNKKKTVSIPKKKGDENKNIVLEYMRDDDELFKNYSNCKHFNSFINKFDHATNN